MKANREQQQAIESESSTLLMAGAGSGKTFVIIEKIIFEIEKIFTSYQEKETSEKEIRERFKKIAVVTFTKYSAQEMKQRILNRLEKTSYPEIIKKSVAEIYVGTIHGLCFQEIRQKFPEKFSENLLIKDQIYIRSKIEKIFTNYMDSLTKETLFYENESLAKETIWAILENPLHRYYWNFKEIDLSQNYYLEYLSYHFKECFVDPVENSIEKYEAFLNNFLSLLQEGETIQEHQTFFAKYPRIPTLTKKLKEKLGPDYSDFHERIKTWKNFLKKYQEDFLWERERLSAWCFELKKALKYIEKNYLKDDFLGYSDLEYYYFLSLKEKKYHFDLFIVDEYQDISFIQYNIFKELTKSFKTHVLFVGDIKQSIYSFRGGESSVLEKTQEAVVNNLELKNNYRSDKEIIFFNNNFFQKTAPESSHFKMIQEAISPEEGIVEAYCFTSEEHQSRQKSEVQKICEIVKEGKEWAILYRKIKHSQYLIAELMAQNIGFTAQVKIEKKQKPGIIIFRFLIDGLFFESSVRNSNVLFNLQACLKILGISSTISEAEIIRFYENMKSFDIYTAYYLFVQKSNLVFSQIDLEFIRTVCQIHNFNLAKISYFFKNTQERESHTITIGSESDKVKIMTTHGSKGLEFDHVILAGLYDYRMANEKKYLGQNYLDILYPGKEKEKKSPGRIASDLYQRRVEKNESIRLLYVACTRAKKKLTLLLFNDSKRKKRESSWNDLFLNYLEYFSHNIKIHQQEKEVSEDLSAPQLPLFHDYKIGFDEGLKGSKHIISSEISVSDLLTLQRCSQEFYLKNILKIKPEYGGGPKEFSAKGTSSKERGTLIHKKIENYLKGAGELENSWIKSHIDAYQQAGWTFKSEQKIKFDLCGQFITGMVDALVFPQDSSQKMEIWDFKTGQSSPEKILSYDLQLKAYAYALKFYYNLTAENKIILKIMMIDEEKIIHKTESFDQIKKELESLYQRLEYLEQKNLSYCENCDYYSLCHFQKDIISL